MSSATARFSLAPVALMVVVVVASLAIVEAKLYSVERVSVIQNKMLRYRELAKFSSGITKQEIEAALDEYNEWPQNYVQLSKNKPSLRLAIDFVILPFEWARQHGIVSDEATFKKYLKRSELAYDDMWNLYHGNTELGAKICKSFKFDKLRSYVEGSRPMSQLTVQDFVDVQNEVRQWEARWEEMSEYEDIFACKEELRSILNYVLNGRIMALKTAVFPLLKKEKDPRKLMDLWRREMWESYGRAFVNGAWKVYLEYGKGIPMPGAPEPEKPKETTRKILPGAKAPSSFGTLSAFERQLLARPW